MQIIELQDISRVFQRGPDQIMALREINLNIGRGEYVAITGSSGSGKSTLLYLLGLLDVATSGRYYLNSELVSGLDDQALSQRRNSEIGFIFQSFHLLPRANALRNVELPLVYSKSYQSGISSREIRQRSQEVLKRVGLADRMLHLPNELSGGQRQRVAIARALVTNPKIILADEPTGNLDSKTGAEVLELLQELSDHGSTVIMVTHDKEIAQKAKRQLVMKDGKIIIDSKRSDANI